MPDGDTWGIRPFRSATRPSASLETDPVSSERTGKKEKMMDETVGIPLEEIESYKPFKGYGIRIIISLVILVTAYGWVCGSLYGAQKIQDTTHMAVFVLFCVACGVITIQLTVLAVKEFPLKNLDDVKEYYDRNIVGYKLFAYVKQRDIGDDQEFGLCIFRRGQTQLRERNPHYSSFNLPLGGWFHFPFVGYDSQGWKVKLSKKYPLNEIHQYVWLRDRNKVWLHMPLDQAFYFHKRWAGTEWGNLVSHLTREWRKEEKSRREWEKCARDNLVKCRSAEEVLIEAINAIKNTSRLGRSKEAARIRKEILEQGLLNILPIGDSRRKTFEQAA